MSVKLIKNTGILDNNFFVFTCNLCNTRYIFEQFYEFILEFDEMFYRFCCPKETCQNIILLNNPKENVFLDEYRTNNTK